MGSWAHRRMHEAIPAEVSEVGASPGLAQMVTVDVVLYLRGLGCARAGGDSRSRCCVSGPFGGGVRERDLGRTGFCGGCMGWCARDVPEESLGRCSRWSVSVVRAGSWGRTSLRSAQSREVAIACGIGLGPGCPVCWRSMLTLPRTLMAWRGLTAFPSRAKPCAGGMLDQKGFCGNPMIWATS